MAAFDHLFSLTGKTALVTGGSSGIGRMIAEGLMRGGARVLIASRKADACEAVARELNALGLPGQAEGFGGDVSSEEGVNALVAEVNKRTSALHILVNNAGRSWGKPLGEFPFAAWSTVMNLNMAGLFTLTQSLLPVLEASSSPDDPARVINLGSVMGSTPLGDGAYSYAASKAGVHQITRILAKEIAGRHITVNAFAPGPFISKMTAFAIGSQEGQAATAAGVPLKRVGRPEDIMAATLFLCGPGGSYVTGAILPLDGGVHIATGPELFGEH